MNKVEFDKDASVHYVKVEEQNISKMAQWVIKLSGGVIKNAKQAELVLLVFVVIVLSFSFYLSFSEKEKGMSQKISPEMTKQLESMRGTRN